MEILVKAVDDASGVLDKIAKGTENVEQKAKGLSGTMQAALGALSAYAGSRGLMSLVGASEQANLQIAQARFHLVGFGGDVSANLRDLQAWAVGMQKAGIAGDEYATLVAAKLTPRVKNLSKAQEYANVLLRGERLGILNAQEAANMMIRATEGNERALRFLVEQMGIAVPEFVSLQTLFEELRRRIEGGEEALSPFAIAMRQLRENMSDFAETAGAPLARFFAFFLQSINALIDRFPAVGTAVAGALAVIATALTGLGLGLGLSSLLGLLGLSVAFGPWGLAIGAAIGLVVFYLSQLAGMSEQTKQRWQVAFTLMIAAAGIAAAAISAVFFLPLMALLAGLFIATQMSIEGYKLSWTGFKDFLKDTFVGIGIIIKETWTATIDWLKSQFDAFVGWINNKVQEVFSAVARAISAVSSLPGVSSVVSAAKSAVGSVSGKRAAGGPVSYGSSYLVGERGPEIFTPRSAGMITANGGGGAGILIDMRGSTFMDRQAAVQIGDEIIKRLKELHRIGRT